MRCSLLIFTGLCSLVLAGGSSDKYSKEASDTSQDVSYEGNSNESITSTISAVEVAHSKETKASKATTSECKDTTAAANQGTKAFWTTTADISKETKTHAGSKETTTKAGQETTTSEHESKSKQGSIETKTKDKDAGHEKTTVHKTMTVTETKTEHVMYTHSSSKTVMMEHVCYPLLLFVYVANA